MGELPIEPDPATSRRDRRRSDGAAQILSTLRPWLASGWLAVSIAAAIMLGAARLGVDAGLAAALALAVGGFLVATTAPWSALRSIRDDRETIRSLVTRLQAIDLDDRRQAFTTVLLARDDELGELSRSVHDCLVRASAAHAEARRVQRTMRDAVDRTTRSATAKLARESVSDALTGVGNRRVLDELAAEVRAAGESAARNRLVALMIDLDNFKQVNDSLGHEAGDACLVFLADLLRSGARHEDVVVRLGGDEFVVVLRDETRDSAAAFASRLRALFAQMPWPHQRVPRPSLSIGIAEAALPDPQALERVLREADEALYVVKRSGRNGISSHPITTI